MHILLYKVQLKVHVVHVSLTSLRRLPKNRLVHWCGMEAVVAQPIGNHPIVGGWAKASWPTVPHREVFISNGVVLGRVGSFYRCCALSTHQLTGAYACEGEGVPRTSKIATASPCVLWPDQVKQSTYGLLKLFGLLHDLRLPSVHFGIRIYIVRFCTHLTFDRDDVDFVLSPH